MTATAICDFASTRSLSVSRSPTNALAVSGGMSWSPTARVASYVQVIIRYMLAPGESPRTSWADPTRSARWPAWVNLAANWQQIAPIVPVLPTQPTHKCCAVNNMPFYSFHGMEEVVGSIPTRSTIESKTYRSFSPRLGNIW